MKPAFVAIGLPVVAAFLFSAIRWRRARSVAAFLRLLGAALLIVMVLTHLAEAVGAIPSMGWGLPNSPGHYVDLVSAVAGIVLFSIGCLLAAARNRY